MENVELIPIEFDSNSLIQNAQVVSTLTGTIGWEAIRKGIPAIIWGDAYYKACKAARSVSSISECQQAIQDLTRLTKDQIHSELFRYILYYLDQGYLANVVTHEVQFSESPEERNREIRRMLKKIKLSL